MNKAIFEHVPMEVFVILSKRIKEQPEIWAAVTLRYDGTDVCGTLTVECPISRLDEYKKALELFIEERFN